MRIATSLIAAILTGCGAGSSTIPALLEKPPPPPPPTIQEYTRDQIVEINKQLASGSLEASGSLKKMVEEMHPGVTYTGATLTSLRLTTVDGTSIADHDGANIAEVHIVVMLRWSGLITTDGFTEVLFVYDRPAKRVKETSFPRSNALLNLDKIDLVDVGKTIASLVLARGLR